MLPSLSQALGRGLRGGGGPAVLPSPQMGEAPPLLGEDAPRTQLYRIDLTTARGTPQEIPLAGSFLWAHKASHPAAWLELRMGDPMGAPMRFRQESRLSGLAFASLWVTNVAQPGHWIELIYTDASIDSYGGLDPRSGLVWVTSQWLFGGNISTQVAWANPRRLELLVRAVWTTAQSVCVVNSVDPTALLNGFPLYIRSQFDSDMLQIPYTGDLWARSSMTWILFYATEILRGFE